MAAAIVRAGELAYFDSFAGLVPVKVTSVDKPGSGTCVTGLDAGRVTMRVTATRGAYKAGEEFTGATSNVIPRSHVRGMRRMSGPRLRSDYRWE